MGGQIEVEICLKSFSDNFSFQKGQHHFSKSSPRTLYMTSPDILHRLSGNDHAKKLRY
jgi:hypothetical protein